MNFKKQQVINSPIQEYLEKLHQRLSKMDSGTVATYIPELGKADPEWFGICVVTADGRIYETGNTGQTFTIQSISKPYTYGLALEDNGRQAVLDKVWVEPSGEAFNSISLDPATGRPVNPMINAGAIATSSLVRGKTSKEKINRILEAFSRHAGRKLAIDQKVYESESETGHRNRAIAHMLRNFDIIGEDPLPSLDAYFMQCSILVNCRDLGIMAATLANAGVNPVTGERAVAREHVVSMLSVMGSCGMYDAAGEWIYNVGMPAKSGVAGGILAVLPGKLGIGVFSPRLDSHGNSVRGIEACRELSRAFDLHMFNTAPLQSSVIRRKVTAGEVGSNRLRHENEAQLLQKSGAKILRMEIQGALAFTGAEVVLREAAAEMPERSHLLLDFGHVQSVDMAARQLLSGLFESLQRSGKQVVVCAAGHLPGLVEELKAPKNAGKLQLIQDGDLAMEWCENALIESEINRTHSSQRVTLADCELLQHFSAIQLAVFEKMLAGQNFKQGEKIISCGDKADKFYFLMKGKVSVWVSSGKADGKRVATFLPGMAFGEMALLDNAPRSAEVRADSDIECMVFPMEKLDPLSIEQPQVMIQLLSNLSLVLARRLRKANKEITILCQ